MIACFQVFHIKFEEVQGSGTCATNNIKFKNVWILILAANKQGSTASMDHNKGAKQWSQIITDLETSVLSE